MLFQYILDKRLKEPVRSGPAAAAPDHMLLLCGIIFHSSHHQRKTVIVEPPSPFRLSSSRLPQLVWYDGGRCGWSGQYCRLFHKSHSREEGGAGYFCYIIMIINIQGKV